MDFLDLKKQRRHRILLFVGYALITVAIVIGTMILLYQAYGFGVDSNGKVIQNGLVFASSQPRGADIYLNGTRYKTRTNTRMALPAGTYSMKLTENGYRDWQRQVVVGGGDVQHFDYPFLFPKTLATTTVTNLDTDPGLASQSPDKRWLLLGQGGSAASLKLYDLKTPKAPIATEVALPAASYTVADGAQSWTVVEWAADNRHVLLQHDYTLNQAAATEYILLDVQTPANSLNLTKALNLNAAETISLFNKKSNQFYVYDKTAKTLATASTDNSIVPATIQHVLAYKTYGSNTVLYVTDQPPTGKLAADKVGVVMQQGSKTVELRALPAGATTYLLNVAQYSGDWYVAVAADNDTGVYLYKDPQTVSIQNTVDGFPPVLRLLRLVHPTYLSFSDTAQFIMAESGQQFVVYDAENIQAYRYSTSQPLDQPQTHASWMDGNRLLYTSKGVLTVFDYDYQNIQTLQAASPSYSPAFAANYSYVYTVAPTTADGKTALTSTALTTSK